MCASSHAAVSLSANPTSRRAARVSNSTPRATAGLALEAEPLVSRVSGDRGCR